MVDGIFIQDRFTLMHTLDNGDQVPFSDALILPAAEYKALSVDQIEALKQERLAAWKEKISAPPNADMPTPEDQLVSINQDLVALDQQKEQLLDLRSDVQAQIEQ